MKTVTDQIIIDLKSLPVNDWIMKDVPTGDSFHVSIELSHPKSKYHLLVQDGPDPVVKITECVKFKFTITEKLDILDAALRLRRVLKTMAVRNEAETIAEQMKQLFPDCVV